MEVSQTSSDSMANPYDYDQRVVSAEGDATETGSNVLSATGPQDTGGVGENTKDDVTTNDSEDAKGKGKKG